MTRECFIRRAVPMDVQALIAIERAIAEAPHWSEEVWRGVVVAVEGLVYERACFAAQKGDHVVGFIVTRVTGGVAELESVVVIDAMKRKGLGRALCVAAMEWAWAAGAEVMVLEVRASNVGALSLYGSLGFREQGRRKGYYRDPVEEALLMLCRRSSDVIIGGCGVNR